MNEELKTKLGELLVALIPQIESDLNALTPKDRVKLWSSLSAMYLHESSLEFIESDDDDDDEVLIKNEAYN